MRILVTGGSGFLGQYVVQTLLKHSYFVRATVRPGQDLKTVSWIDHPSVDVREVKFNEPNGLIAALEGVDAVIHLVASKSSNFEEAYQGTVVTTQNLLAAMEKAQVGRLVAISSFSVYDYGVLAEGSYLDESCPLEASPEWRDAYARTKLLQEQDIRNFAALPQTAVTILRPGMIYGPGALWNATQGTKAGPVWLLIEPDAQMPLTYVENCAEAIVATVKTEHSVGAILNIVDDDLPTRKAYTSALIQGGDWAPTVIPISWKLFRGLIQLLWSVQKILFLGKLKLPGLLIPSRLDARLKPLIYTNSQAKKILDWQPYYGWQAALEKCFESTFEPD